MWPEIWIGMSKADQKQDWAVEKPKLDNAGKLRGIYFIDPEDEEHKETIEKKKKTQERNSKLLWKRLRPARWRQESVLRIYWKL